ncbi:MAG TPA: hypothetical protein VLW05_05250 [Gaiellaceae bacterium]|nr:hypothetical protein [Gaiellaceae bacterium]
MRRLFLLVPVVLVAAACGGGGSGGKSSHSVLEVSKAFSDAGLPFTGIVTGNPYIAGQVPFLPFKLNSSDLRFDVLAQLSGSDTTEHTGEVVWVFDTDAHAQEALKQVPLSRWGQGPLKITRAVLGNVVVVGDGFSGAQKQKLDAAIAALK